MGDAGELISGKYLKKTMIFTMVLAISYSFVPAYAFSGRLLLTNNSDYLLSQNKLISVAENSPEVSAGARNFVESMAARGMGFLSDPDLDHKNKKKKFKTLLQDSFDMNTIGRFALGRYWRVATQDQKDEYLKLFNDMVISVYSNRFSDYDGQDFNIAGSRADGEKDTIVTSFIIPANGSKIQVDWRVRYKNGKYRIIDVIVEGVSMSVTQRSDFAAVIQRGGGDVKVLIAHLRGEQNQDL